METIVNRTVLGSANPLARKFRDIKSAVGGIGGGIVAIIIGFILVYTSVYSVKEHSKVVAALPLEQASEVEANVNETVKIQGQPVLSVPRVLSYQMCDPLGCQYALDASESIGNALYINGVYERYEVVKVTKTETRIVTEGGQDIEETVETTSYEEQWVEQGQKELWSEFNLANFQINPENAKLVSELEEEVIENVYIPNATNLNTYDQEVSAQVGDTRLNVSYLPLPDQVIVVGDVVNGEITGGDTFIVSDLGDSELVERLKSEEQTTRIVMRVVSWLMLTAGFTALLAPLMELIEIVPLFGGMIKAVAGVISAIVAAVIVLGGVLILKYWYLCLLGFVILLGVGIWVLVKRKKPASAPAAA